MINIVKPEDCCGCTACASVCSRNAISMTPDALGFLYPKVNLDLCTNCGLCEKVCAFNNEYDRSQNITNPEVFGARHKDIREVETSRSGAAFIAISDWILAHGGVVYGAGYTDHFRVVHKRATTKGERDEFKGSKYVQSDLTGVFHQVKNDLKSCMVVLFSGTPCQTAGLRSFVGKKLQENLYLVDIVCHGTPSPNIWKDYINYIESKQSGKVVKVDFREKSENGWTDHKEAFVLDNSSNRWKYDYVQMNSPWKTWYTVLFYQHIMFRHSCGNCHYCNTQRPSDITIADFWGWEKTDPEINIDDKGLSLVMVNTVKGRGLFEGIKKDLDVIPAELEDCLQPNLQHPSVIHPKRLQFEKDYVEKGFEYIYNHDYDAPSMIRRVKNKVKLIIKLVIGK